MMYDAIRNFNLQFAYQPVLEGGDVLPRRQRFLVAGMGGSALAGKLIASIRPELNLVTHRNYGLPKSIEEHTDEWMCVAISYSGNTEETIDAYARAVELGIPTVAIASGGKLLEMARSRNGAYIALPEQGIQPRSAIGFMCMALLVAIREESALSELRSLAEKIHPDAQEDAGKKIAKKLKNKIPIIYSSENNAALGYVWKIKCNENAKVPAFANVLPEANHNEMSGFEVNDLTKKLSKHFAFIFLTDASDHPRVQRRMEVYKNLLEENGYFVIALPLEEGLRSESIFKSSSLADWTSFHMADMYKIDPGPVATIERFKRLL